MSYFTDAKCHGPQTLVASVTWNATSAPVQVLTDSKGVASVTRSAAGTYAVNLAIPASKHVEAVVQVVQNDITNYHFCEITSITNSVVNIKHRTVAYAGVAGPPSLSDNAGNIQVLIFARVVT